LFHDQTEDGEIKEDVKEKKSIGGGVPVDLVQPSTSTLCHDQAEDGKFRYWKGKRER
jgi:hypothetical protein